MGHYWDMPDDHSPSPERVVFHTHSMLVRWLGALLIVMMVILALLLAFDWGQSRRCDHYRQQGGPQWAIDRYCTQQR